MTILVVGDANADLSAAVNRFPHEGDDLPIAALEWGSGGSAANVATALTLLGAPVQLLARVGRDPAAEVALRVARAAGVNLDAVQRDDSLATGLCFVAISPGGGKPQRGASAIVVAIHWIAGSAAHSPASSSAMTGRSRA